MTPINDHLPQLTNANSKTKAKAKTMTYGEFCQAESKRHTAGQHGTPLSTCVTDMTKLASRRAKNPTSACQGESKQHVVGQHGTPLSICVFAAAKLLAGAPPTPTHQLDHELLGFAELWWRARPVRARQPTPTTTTR